MIAHDQRRQHAHDLHNQVHTQCIVDWRVHVGGGQHAREQRKHTRVNMKLPLDETRYRRALVADGAL
eukprot:6460951-Prorocentrum_lima.AAC.1